MKGERSGLSRSGDWTQGNQNGRRKVEGGTGIADTDMCQGHTEVPRTGKLLLPIY